MPARRMLRLRRTAFSLALLAVAGNSRLPFAQSVGQLHLTSPSFSGAIPDRYASCNGRRGNSPALVWDAPPASTRSFALVVTDPDAPLETFTHWLLWNVPAGTRSLPESVPAQPQLPSGARQGRNDFGNIGYGGPCPPGRSGHRYVFDLYALDIALSLAPGASKRQLLEALHGHIVAAGELVGRYPR
ncbi:MAG TPA: YbhB/YbcL family Raf kinase inhibitor-like protein [Acidobacteriaceae bacterium]|nr:YbhB/YbcL family Raf kinase inhibitor-like protein [Acidobacteriaceae bacterium]